MPVELRRVSFSVSAPSKPDIKSLPLPNLEQLLQVRGHKAYRAKQIADWLYKKRVPSFEAMTDLPQATCE